jgi:uncharacterized membrane protein
MFQTHAYDAWLAPEERTSQLFRWSQLLGTFPAPLFLTLAGVSAALIFERAAEKGEAPGVTARRFAKRGAEVFGIALLFRLQQMVFGWGPWTDLLRVDVLNTIGVSLAAVGLLAYAPPKPRVRIGIAAGIALAIAMLTPPLHTTWKIDSIPWWLASYIHGGHTDYVPKGWLFPLFPWSAFTFAGAAAGIVVARAHRLGRDRAAVLGLAAAGIAMFLIARALDHSQFQLYSVYEYWRTSPNFFVARVGCVLVLMALCWAWCAVKPAAFSPVAQLGTTSLLVYWVHIELVYGRLSIMPKRECSIATASLGLAGITVSMVLLSMLDTRIRARRAAMAPTARV